MRDIRTMSCSSKEGAQLPRAALAGASAHGIDT